MRDDAHAYRQWKRVTSQQTVPMLSVEKIHVLVADRRQWRGGRITVFTGMENPREVQIDELKLGRVAFRVSVDDLGGEVVGLVYLGR